MVKKFFAVFGLVLLYMAAWVPCLLVWILIAGENDALIAVGVLAAMVLIVVGLVPYMAYVTRQVFYFPGQGPAVPEAELRRRVLEANQFDAPVMVAERGKELLVTWKYVDAKWWELLAKAGLTRIYELHVKFDDARKEATLVDVKKSVSWRAGPTQVRLGGGFFRGVDLSFEIGQAWGIRENFQLGKVYEYKFVTSEIKSPVMNTILRSGWAVRFGIF
jgi:hypothetical protein